MSYTLYCLFQLYIATHDLLHEYNSTAKFVAIKAILGIAVLQSMIINVVVHKFVPEDDRFSQEMQSEFWSDFALVCEAVVLAWMHRDAYPWAELEDKNGKRKKRIEEAKQLALVRAALPEHGHHHDSGEKDHAPHVRCRRRDFTRSMLLKSVDMQCLACRLRLTRALVRAGSQEIEMGNSKPNPNEKWNPANDRRAWPDEVRTQ